MYLQQLIESKEAFTKKSNSVIQKRAIKNKYTMRFNKTSRVICYFFSPQELTGFHWKLIKMAVSLKFFECLKHCKKKCIHTKRYNNNL